MTVFVEDHFAGDALATAESDLTVANDHETPDGASIIASMRDYEGELGGMFVISGSQVSALAGLCEWLHGPALEADRLPPADGVAVCETALAMHTEPGYEAG